MFEVRLHGRGGQGIVTAAEMLAVATYSQGKYAQAFPGFGLERTRMPSVAYCRFDDAPIRRREPVLHPDALIVQDPMLVRQLDVFEGVRPDGYVLVNSSQEIDELGLDDLIVRHGLTAAHLLAVPATEIALRTLGHPLPNTALLGAFAAQTGVITLEAVETAVRERFAGRVAADNIEAARAAHALVEHALGGRARGEARI